MSTTEPPEEAPPPTPWQPTTAPRPAARPQVIAWLILALVVVVAAVGTAPFWAPALLPVLPWGQQPAAPPPVAAAPDTGAIRDLQSRLDTDEAALKDQAARLAALEARPIPRPEPAPTPVPAPIAATPPRPATPTAAAPPAQNPATADAIKALQDQLAKLAAAEAAAGEKLGQLETKVATAAATGRANSALLTALANLRIAAEGSGPYIAELAAVQALADDKADTKDALASLAADAKAGLPSMAVLTERFDRRVAPAILRARGDTKSGDWWQQIQARLERLVVIRRVAPGGPAPRDATEAAVAKADAALRAGDLAAAVASLDDLSGAAARAAASWQAQAKKRVAAEATLAKLWRDELAKSGEAK